MSERHDDEQRGGWPVFYVGNFGPEAEEAAAWWKDAQEWRWVDALAWLARREPQLMMLLRAYRRMIEAESVRFGSRPHVEGEACRLLLGRVPAAELHAAARKLTMALKDGTRLQARSAVDLKPITAAEWIAQVVPDAGGIPEAILPDVLLPAADVRKLCGPAEADGTTGDPGRPEKGAQLYLAEFHRRAEAGKVEAKLADEAKALWEWFRNEHPGRALPTTGTIANRIRDQHRKHRGEATK